RVVRNLGSDRLAVARHRGRADAVLPAAHLVAVLARRARDDVEQIERLGKERLADERGGGELAPSVSGQKAGLREQDLAHALAVLLRHDQTLLESRQDPVDAREGRPDSVAVDGPECATANRIE